MASRNKLKYTKRFIDFSNSSPTPFHCVESSILLLKKAGFKRISLKKVLLDIKPNSKYFFTRNGSSIIAFAVGGRYRPKNGIIAVAAHTDSPCFQLKPCPEISSNGYMTIGLQTYGGLHLNSWFDRDLSVAGRVFVNLDHKLQSRLVDFRRPIMSIPKLAIHLESNSDCNKMPNSENKFRPILFMSEKMKESSEEKILLKEISKELNVPVENIRSLSLFLYDSQKTSFGGLKQEFVYGSRLDNQLMSYVSLDAFLESINGVNKLEYDKNIRLLALFDNEEIGSISNRGARSRFLLSSLERIVGQNNLNECLEKSLLLSADMSHGLHPNYKDKHEINSQILLGKGPIISFSAKENMATTDISSLFLEDIVKRSKIPVQKYCARADQRSGSTVGPILSSNCGIRTVEFGISQLAMHSVREMCCSEDIEKKRRIVTAWKNVEKEIKHKMGLIGRSMIDSYFSEWDVEKKAQSNPNVSKNIGIDK